MEAWAFFVYLLPELITATSIFFVLGMESRQMKQETGGNSAIVAVDVHQDCRLASLYCERVTALRWLNCY